METLRPLLPDQEFFSMRDACRLVQLPAHTLRHWESRVGLLRPARLRSGHRRYAKRDLETALRIKELLRDRRMTLTGARRALLREQRGRPEAAGPAAGPGDAALAKVLREVRDGLREILSEMK